LPLTREQATEQRARANLLGLSADTDPKAMPPEYVITLVHGTQLSRWFLGPLIEFLEWPRRIDKEFKDGPPWIQANSEFARKLSKALGCGVRIEPFSWKAHNTVRARTVGAEKLRTKVKELRDQYPHAEQVIIAHSHGGNVALSALMDNDVAKQVLGVATLATPFLTARTREHRGLLDLHDAVMAALMAGFAMLAVGVARGHGWLWGWALAVSVGVVSLILGGVGAMMVMKKNAESIARRMQVPVLRTEQVTIVRTPGDEAAAVIAGVRVTGAFVNVIWRGVIDPVRQRLRRLLDWTHYLGGGAVATFKPEVWDEMTKKRNEMLADKLGPRDTPSVEEAIRLSGSTLGEAKPPIWKEVANALLPLAALTVVVVFQDSNYSFFKWVILGIGALYGLPAMLALSVAVLSVVPGIVFSLGLLPCGWTVPFAGPFLDVTAEPAPLGSFVVTHFEREDDEGLSHKKSYKHGRVPDHLAAWINACADAKRTKQQNGDSARQS
jgi:hypothetical protein